MSVRVLVVEDEHRLRRELERGLTKRGIEVVGVGTLSEGRDQLLGQRAFHAAVVDLHLPDGRGVELMDRWPEGRRRPPLVVMTGDDSLDSATDALRRGVVDYLLKPFSITALEEALQRALRTSVTPEPAAPADPSTVEGWRRIHAPEMLGDHPLLRRVFEVLRRTADADCPVLIHGETGTGKELVARAIHRASGRPGVLVALNCAAMPEGLVESELFGHARGAFTDATTAREGRLGLAHRGTLFLDEIGEMPLAVQAKLLRVLQEKEYTRVGEMKAQKVDVRVVAATHRDLEALADEGRFRHDLLYRLDVVRVELPPLRKRAEDVPRLVERFVHQANERYGRAVTAVSPELAELLARFEWPGNIRQLENVVSRMVALRGEGSLSVDDLPERMRRDGRPQELPGAVDPTLPEAGLDLRAAVDAYERGLIKQALARSGGNRQRAAQMLSLQRTSLVEKIRRLGVTDDES